MSIFEDFKSGVTRHEPQRVAVLGASGSIGTQTLDVCRKHADRLRVVAVAVNDSVAFAVRAAREFGCAHVVIANEAHRDDPALAELPASCEVSFGQEGLMRVASAEDVDSVVDAVVGFAGIYAGYAALRAGKALMYANKESEI